MNVKVSTLDTNKISNFDKVLDKTDLVYEYSISKIDKDFIYYQITFNNSPSVFIRIMKNNNYNFDTQNKVWILK